MKGFTLNLKKSSKDSEDKIELSVIEKPEENLLYKFIIGVNGTWNTIKDFSENSNAEWCTNENGKYTIMVQAKRKDSSRSFDYVTRMDYITGKVQVKLIDKVSVENAPCKVGEKVIIKVKSIEPGLMYRYLKKSNNEWKLLRDYSIHNIVSWSARTPGTVNIIVECKKPDSLSEFDDFVETHFEVMPIEKPLITKFQSITPKDEMLIDNPILFEAEAAAEKGRSTLFQFVKMDMDQNISIIQEYASKALTCCTETKPGKYSLMCMVKDMYSQEVFDDKKVISYVVKAYKDIVINSFTANVNSPQAAGTSITLNAEVHGGNELVYRFLVEGKENQDSGFGRNKDFIWTCNIPGNYKLTLMVKDVSCGDEYEAIKDIEYIIDEKSSEKVNITQVALDKNSKVLVGNKINIKAAAEGGTAIRYSFIIRKGSNIVEAVDYGTCNWIDFTPNEAGLYELEVRAKDKFSDREFDSHLVKTIEATQFMPAIIEYILVPQNEYFVVGDEIPVNIVIENSDGDIIKYILKINGFKVEETEFEKSIEYNFIPKCSGLYTIEVFAKNVHSDRAYDSMESINIIINDALPITNTKILGDKKEIKCCEPVTFSVHSEGGKEILYEFHLMVLGEWSVVQKYSRKEFYTFVPYNAGKYRILALCKSSFRKCSYEDYDIMEFEVK